MNFVTRRSLAAVLVVGVLCLSLAPVTAIAQDSKRETAQALPDPNAEDKRSDSSKKSRSKGLPDTGLGALPMALIGLLMIAAGRLVLPQVHMARAHDRFAFEIERRRYLAERR